HEDSATADDVPHPSRGDQNHAEGQRVSGEDHCRSDWFAPRPCWIVGSATLTMMTLINDMKIATSTTARMRHRTGRDTDIGSPLSRAPRIRATEGSRLSNRTAPRTAARHEERSTTLP